jgi:multidrug efflux pump subunit AcrA (membrane-fusion protein)
VNTKPISHKKITAIIIIACLVVMPFVSCQTSVTKSAANQRMVISVNRGDLLMTVTASGQLDRPRECKANLSFSTLGTVKKIYVTEGERVRAGTLLAKLDDTAQKIAVTQAQYNVELAMNELCEKIYPALMGYPHYYPDISALFRLEQAQRELEQAQELVGQESYEEAAAGLRIAQYDLEASHEALETTTLNVKMYPDIPQAKSLLEQDLERLEDVQQSMAGGNYVEAAAELAALRDKLDETHQVVNSVCGVIKSYAPPYPDTSTSLDLLRQAEQELQEAQKLREQGNYDEMKVAEMLRQAQHDMELSHTILENNELVFRHGLNLKVLRQNNLNLQKAEEALDSAKQELMKTEILAPFEGTVIAIGLKENDQLSAVDYNSRTAVYLEDTTAVEMNGTIDEIDAHKVEIGQEAVVTVDALPNERLKGVVTFASPSATSQSGAPNVSPLVTNQVGAPSFPIKIRLEPTGQSFQGGLTATANIIVSKRENVLLIPNHAIRGSPGNYWVDVVTDEKTGATGKRQVGLGIQGQDAQGKEVTEVITGLNEGEKVILEALHQ